MAHSAATMAATPVPARLIELLSPLGRRGGRHPLTTAGSAPYRRPYMLCRLSTPRMWQTQLRTASGTYQAVHPVNPNGLTDQSVILRAADGLRAVVRVELAVGA